eukprot:145542_1
MTQRKYHFATMLGKQMNDLLQAYIHQYTNLRHVASPPTVMGNFNSKSRKKKQQLNVHKNSDVSDVLLEAAVARRYEKQLRVWHPSTEEEGLQQQQVFRNMIREEAAKGAIYLFGRHNSGKSTLDNQLSHLSSLKQRITKTNQTKAYNKYYNDNYQNWYGLGRWIKCQCIRHILLLYRICNKLYTLNPNTYSYYFIENNKKIISSYMLLCKYENEPWNFDIYYNEPTIDLTQYPLSQIIENIEYIWNQQAIRRCYKHFRGQLFYMTDNMNYWYDSQIPFVFANTQKMALNVDQFMLLNNENYKGIHERSLCVNSTGNVYIYCHNYAIHNTTHGYNEHVIFKNDRIQLQDYSFKPHFINARFVVSLA